MRRMFSRKGIQAGSLLTFVVVSFYCSTGLVMKMMKRSPERALDDSFVREGTARVSLHRAGLRDSAAASVSSKWNHRDAEYSFEKDVRCRQMVPEELVATMTNWGQWAATKSFIAEQTIPFEGGGSRSTKTERRRTQEEEVAPSSFCNVGSFKRIVGNREWTLEQFDWLSDRLPDFSDLRSYSYVMIKPLEEKDTDSVLVIRNSTEATYPDGIMAMTTTQGQHYFIQAYKLAYTMDMGNDFCNGMSMTMAMGGFQWSLFSKEKGDCLTYFAGKWQLDSIGKFHGAMMYSFLLALMTEGITAFQGWIRRFLSGKLRKVVMTSLYGLQQWLGYTTMLITMMYSIELFGCVILGVMVGRTLFQGSGRGRTGVSRVNRNTPRIETEPEVQGNAESDPLIPHDVPPPCEGLRRRRS